MQIFIHTDRNIALTDAQREGFEQLLAGAVDRFDARLTRIEVHLSDVNSTPGGVSDKRCVLETRPAGRQPFAVEHQAATIALAASGAGPTLKNVLESTFGRLDRVRGDSGGIAAVEIGRASCRARVWTSV